MQDAYKILNGLPEEKNRLEDLGVDGKMVSSSTAMNQGLQTIFD
jgi:hypothetical protein